MLKIKAETVNSNKSKYFLTHSLNVAKRYKLAKKGRRIYKLPNGVYAIKK